MLNFVRLFHDCIDVLTSLYSAVCSIIAQNFSMKLIYIANSIGACISLEMHLLFFSISKTFCEWVPPPTPPNSLHLTKIYENVSCRFETRGLTQHMFQRTL